MISYPGTMAMESDHNLVQALKSVPHSHILETGTYLGNGSSQMLLSLNPEVFITIEANIEHWTEARLRLPNSVQVIHGLSVNRNDANDFIKSDHVLNNHSLYPHIHIDGLHDPVEFYSKEVNVSGPDSLLVSLLPTIADHNPIILLDSAGGIGLLEFQTVCSIMGERPFTLVLDDIHHIKHFRSVDAIQNDSQWSMIYKSESALVASFSPYQKQKAYIILGRFGDIYMVCRELKDPSLIACLPEFASIVEELFPQHILFKLPPIPKNNPIMAAQIVEMAFPDYKIIVPQLDGLPPESCLPFRSYQSYQISAVQKNYHLP